MRIGKKMVGWLLALTPFWLLAIVVGWKLFLLIAGITCIIGLLVLLGIELITE